MDDIMITFHKDCAKQTENFIATGEHIIIYGGKILKIGDIITYDTKYNPGKYFKVIYFFGSYMFQAMNLAFKDKSGIFRIDIPKNNFDGINPTNESYIRKYVKLASQEDIFIINKLLTFQ